MIVLVETTNSTHDYIQKIVLNVVIHDMANYIQAIEGYNKLIIKYIKKDNRIKDLLENQEEVIKATKDFLSNVRLINRAVGLGKEEFIERELIPIKSLIRKAIVEARAMHPEKTLNYHISSEIEVLTRLSEVLNVIFKNVLTNSLKHNEGNKVHITIEIKMVSDLPTVNDYFEIRFCDNGSGFKNKILSNFDKYYKAIIAKEKFFGEAVKDLKGMGFGLFTIRFLTEIFDGKFYIQNHKNGGAVVGLRYPIDGDLFCVTKKVIPVESDKKT